jgi:PTS system nitrogen regulatory IIA component
MDEEAFDVNSLAAYLHLLSSQVTRLADRGQLPGRKVAGQWRFARAEIHHWLENRIGLSDDEGLVQMEDALRRSAPPAAEPICIAQLLRVEAIAVPLQARTRGSVITEMSALAARTGLLWDPAKMAEAVRDREAMHPTALDIGVALLHPRRPMTKILDQALLALGVTSSGIPFGSGGMLTDIFFLICSVDDQGHLRTLARLSRILGSPGVLTSVREAANASTVHQIVAQCEADLA